MIFRKFGATPDSPNQCLIGIESGYEQSGHINIPNAIANKLYDQFTFQTEDNDNDNDNKSHFILIAENRAYGMVPSIGNDDIHSSHETHTSQTINIPRPEHKIAMEDTEFNSGELPTLQSEDLLMFAKQIATGMVSV